MAGKRAGMVDGCRSSGWMNGWIDMNRKEIEEVGECKGEGAEIVEEIGKLGEVVR